MDITYIYAKTRYLLLTTHYYHIRSLGANYVFHEETGKQYEELSRAIDVLGEQIMILEKKLPDTVELFLEEKTPKAMLEELYEDNEELVEMLDKVSKTAKDEGTKTLLADRLNVHAKACMKLKSIQF